MSPVGSKIASRGTLTLALCASLGAITACGSNSGRSEGTPPLARRGANGTYVADYIETQGGAASLNRDAERATLLTRTGQVTAGGGRAELDLRFLIFEVRPGKPAAFEISTAGFTTLNCARGTLRSRSSRPAEYRLLIYKNPARVKLLYQATFRSGGQPQSIHVPLDGAVDVWLVWEAVDHRVPPSAEFTMIAPRFTSGPA